MKNEQKGWKRAELTFAGLFQESPKKFQNFENIKSDISGRQHLCDLNSIEDDLKSYEASMSHFC